MKLLGLGVETFWRCLIVVVTLYQVTLLYTGDSWVFEYLVPFSGIYWVLIPFIEHIRTENKKRAGE